MAPKGPSTKTPVLKRRWRPVLGLVVGWMALAGCAPVGGASTTQPTARTAGIEWIDVHTHLVGGRADHRQDFWGAVTVALAAADASRIRKMVVMPPPQIQGQPGLHDYDSFASAIKRHPTRLAFLGGGGSLNVILQEAGQDTTISDRLRRKFEDKALEILREGAAGFGEITAHHLSHMAGHPYESVPADHPLLLLLADIAARHDVVVDLHFDPVVSDVQLPEWLVSPPNPPILRANVAAFERLLEHNRKAKIVWAHAGSDEVGHWTADLSQRLLEKYPNLYMSLRMGPAHAPQNHTLTRAGEIKPEWLRLFQDFPDRFVIGGDQFFVSPSVSGAGPGVVFSHRASRIRERTGVFLGALPPDLARRIGYENAIRLYKLRD